MIFAWFLIFILCCGLSSSQQFYDQTLCFSNTNFPGTRYTCTKSSPRSCQTYLVYRANGFFKTISNISSLFQKDPNELVSINNFSNSMQILDPGHEVLVPITCSCRGEFFQASVVYKWPENITLSKAACEIFEGLVKSITLAEELDLSGNDTRPGTKILVPLKCACPDSNSGARYLITYPFIKGDDTKKLSKKFNVSDQEIWAANHLDPTVPTVYPTTTVLVPLKQKPFIDSSVLEADPPIPQFLPTSPVEKNAKISQLKKVCVAGLVIGFSLVVALSVACGLYIKALKKFKEAKSHSRTRRISSLNYSCSTPRSTPATRSSTNSCLSPDLLNGIKYTLSNYEIEEIKQATRNFDTKISANDVYKGSIGKDEVMVKRMAFGDTRQVIDVHSKINHVNIVKLNGVCYGEGGDMFSYLVFEYPLNGILRDCLATSSSALHWHRRTQIAFDIATGLHYLHYSVIPAYAHLSLNSNNIFLTLNWRAKIAVFGNGKESDIRQDSWMAPENCYYIRNEGIVNEKVDIFAFGLVLLELISGKETMDGKIFRESIRFLGCGGSNSVEGGCFDQLRNFVDPCFKDDYPIAEALCLAVLACSCVDEDPLHRPSMDDVIKILARMV